MACIYISGTFAKAHYKIVYSLPLCCTVMDYTPRVVIQQSTHHDNLFKWLYEVCVQWYCISLLGQSSLNPWTVNNWWRQLFSSLGFKAMRTNFLGFNWYPIDCTTCISNIQSYPTVGWKFSRLKIFTLSCYNVLREYFTIFIFTVKISLLSN